MPETPALSRPQCAADEVNTGGGYAVSGTTDPAAYTVVWDRPDANGWAVGLWVAPGYGSVNLTAYAVCVKKLSGGTLTRQVVTVGGIASWDYAVSAKAYCPSGYVRTGGGHYNTSVYPTKNVVTASIPSDHNSWKVTYKAGTGEEFWSQVVCIKAAADAPLDVWTEYESFTVPGQSNATESVGCGSGTVTGGGWSVSDINPTRYLVHKSYALNKRLVSIWSVSVFGAFDAGSGPLDARAWAVCLKTAY